MLQRQATRYHFAITGAATVARLYILLIRIKKGLFLNAHRAVLMVKSYFAQSVVWKWLCKYISS